MEYVGYVSNVFHPKSRRQGKTKAHSTILMFPHVIKLPVTSSLLNTDFRESGHKNCVTRFNITVMIGVNRR